MKSQSKSMKSRIWNFARTVVLNNADAIFACSGYSKKICAGVCANKKILVIHPPIQFVDNNIILNNCNHIIFSVGRHVERKGFQDTIRAMPLILAKYPHVQYRIAGDGTFHEELMDLAVQYKVENHVKFLGRISEEQKKEEFSNCDIFIMTSHEDKMHLEVEGFGICYLEANMYGKWVIACDTGGVSDAVKNGITGELLDEPSAEKIYHAVDNYYSKKRIDKKKIVDWAKSHDCSIIAQQYINAMEFIYSEQKQA